MERRTEYRNERFFEAGNLYLATFLVFRGFPMKGISGCGKSKRIQFDNSPEINKTSTEFFADSEARRLFDCYRRTKDYLFQNGL